MLWIWILGVVLVFLILVALRDITQRKHAIMRNFPVIGRLRYMIEAIGPEMRQYVVASNNEERPFTRDQRSWVYASSKEQNNYFGFGTDENIELNSNHLFIKHSAFPLPDDHDDPYSIPSAKILGEYRGRSKAFRPSSVVNVSAMSYGSLSGAAVEAINRGCARAEAMQNTGEGGVSRYHKNGGDLIWQIGTGYFGCRNPDGTFSLERLVETVEATPSIRALEIKLSQGAKPGLGGVLPGHKVTPVIAEARGIPVGETCISPPNHSAFHDVDSLLDFVESLAGATGLPVGVKAAVGTLDFWEELVAAMASGERMVDFIVIDGGEGGTGAAPLVYADHVSLPFKMGFTRVYTLFARAGLTDKVTFVGSGKLGFPEDALLAFALGCDMVHVAREVMLSIGCIQAQKCHTNHCPAGVATQNAWLARGLDPTLKAARLANYLMSLRKEILRLSHTCGVPHPAFVTCEHFEIVRDHYNITPIQELFEYDSEWGRPSQKDLAAITQTMKEIVTPISA